MIETDNCRAYMCADRRLMLVNGPMYHAMDRLILGRKLGIGTPESALDGRITSLSELLAKDKEVLLGRRAAHRFDTPPGNFERGEAHLYLLEPWYDLEELESGEYDNPVPWEYDSFEPFVQSGNIGSEREIQLLKPAQLLPKGIQMMLRRDQESTLMSLSSLARRVARIEEGMAYHECA